MTLLQPGVPIGAHAREDSQLLAAQTGDPAPPARGKAHLAWGDFGASGGEEVPDLGAAVHASTIRAGDHAKGVELVPPTSSAFLATVSGGEVGNDAGTPNAMKGPPMHDEAVTASDHRPPVTSSAPSARLPLVVYVLAVGTFLMLTSEFVVAGILPEIAGDLQVSLARAGSLITAFALGMILGAPLMAMLTMRLSKRLTL